MKRIALDPLQIDILAPTTLVKIDFKLLTNFYLN